MWKTGQEVVEMVELKMKRVDAVISKYKSIPIPVKASLWSAICSFMQKGISMITMPIFTRLLTTEQYGLYTVYQSWYSVISIFATLNLSAGVFYNGMVKYEGDRARYTSAMQGLTTVVTACLFVIYLVLHAFWNEFFGISSLLMIAMFIELFFVPAYQLWAAKQRFDYAYKQLIVFTTVIAVMSPLIGVITVLSTDYKAEARVLSYVGVQICVGFVLYIYNLIHGRTLYVKKYWHFALAFNIPLIPHYLSMSILAQADRIMISQMVGTSEAAIYGVAYNISQLMILVTTAISSSFNPYSYKALKAEKYDKIKKSANLLLLLVAGAVAFMACFGPELIKIFATEEYYDARWIIPPVSLSVYFVFLYPLFSNVEFYFEKNKFVTVASTVGAMLNLILNYFAIPIFGYIAAGYTTLICYIMFVVAHYICYLKVLDEKAPGVQVYDMKYIIFLSISLVAFVLNIVFFYDLIIIRYGVILLIFMLLLVKRNDVIGVIKGLKK